MNDYSTISDCRRAIRDGNGLNLNQDPRDPNPIRSDLGQIKMNLDRIWISMHGSKVDMEQVRFILISRSRSIFTHHLM